MSTRRRGSARRTIPTGAVYIPFSEARRRHGVSLLTLAIIGLCAVIATLFVQTPATLHRAMAFVTLVLIAIFMGTAVVGLMWAGMIAWPEERRRLQSAASLRRLNELPASRDNRLLALIVPIIAGCLVAGFLWTLLNSIGLIGAPMLWLTVGIINVRIARRIRRVELEQSVIYFAAPPLPFPGARQSLFLCKAPPRRTP